MSEVLGLLGWFREEPTGRGGVTALVARAGAGDAAVPPGRARWDRRSGRALPDPCDHEDSSSSGGSMCSAIFERYSSTWLRYCFMTSP
ncbi:hypothetical protein SAMN04487819_11396 [Actinopolyspora alba]|uniref:Uncharacterized protein n=1 Tax=Actinopolyspora alba TaxID=673379 RepID=A0A1I2AG31_9ACTN|nr:hypothetical protein SAMN04487819_11396 [Actinopolyspora alba]